ncbi:hypothetical protein FRB97_001678 [Tulasnella sp. 331]|nr:hypothetical protein FRB97_001678 [Tulasnella sp. 331]
MAPRLDFYPSLSSTTHVPLTHEVSTSLPYKIQVRLSRAWFDKIYNGGRQIQVWSNIGQRNEHVWQETPFLLPTTDAADVTPKTTDGLVMSLLSSDAGAPVIDSKSLDNDKEVTLVATFDISNVEARYAFTFRIAGPYSQMEWLGNMGSNGILLVGRGGHRVGFASTNASEGAWNLTQGQGVWEGAVGEDQVEIGRIVNTESVDGWAIRTDGSKRRVTRFESVTSNLFIVHPHNNPASHSRAPLPLIISSTAPINMSSGIITVSSVSPDPTRVFVTELNQNRTFAEVKNIIEHATMSAFELVSMVPKSLGFFVLKTNATGRARIEVIPTKAGQGQTRITVPLETALLNASTGSDTYVLYSAANDTAAFVDEAQIHSPEAAFGIVTGGEGGTLSILPVFAVTAEEQSWQVAVVTPEVKVVMRETVEPVIVTEVKVNVESALLPSMQPDPEAAIVEGEEVSASNFPTPPVSVAAALNDLALSQDPSEVDQEDNGESHDSSPDQGEAQTTPESQSLAVVPISASVPSWDVLALVARSRYAMLLSSLRNMASTYILTTWLHVFSLVRFLLLLTSGWRGHPAPPRSRSLRMEEMVVDEDPATTTAPVEEGKPAAGVPAIVEAEAIEDVPEITDTPAVKETTVSSEQEPVQEEKKDDTLTIEARLVETTILTPPATPPTATLPMLADPAVMAPPNTLTKHLLLLTLSSGTQALPLKCIVFHPTSPLAADDVTISVDERDIEMSPVMKYEGPGNGVGPFLRIAEHRLMENESWEERKVTVAMTT